MKTYMCIGALTVTLDLDFDYDWSPHEDLYIGALTVTLSLTGTLTTIGALMKTYIYMHM